LKYYFDVDIRDYNGMFLSTQFRVCKPTGYVKLNMNDSDVVENCLALDNVKNPTPL
jgi:hypothetical protein